MANSFFPQLSVGAVAQYPLRKVRSYRTIKNVLSDGRLIVLPDRAAKRVAWHLSYVNLTADDIKALQSHFRFCQGPLQTFTFLDPTGNLLSFSDKLSASVWLQANQIQVQAGFSDTLKTQNAVRLTNTGQSTSDLYQALSLPANYSYCFSAYVRSDLFGTLALFRRTQTVVATESFTFGSSWRRIYLTGSLLDQGSNLQVGLTLQPGQQVEICGMQLEPQLAPSEYRSTDERCGIYSEARYGMNELLIRADGYNLYSTELLVESSE